MAVGVCFDESKFMLSPSKNVSMSACMGSGKNAGAFFFLPESFKGRKKAKQLREGGKKRKCAKTRAYCLLTVENPRGSCSVLTSNRTTSESCERGKDACFVTIQFILQEENKRQTSVYLLMNVLIFERRKQDVLEDSEAK